MAVVRKTKKVSRKNRNNKTRKYRNIQRGGAKEKSRFKNLFKNPFKKSSRIKTFIGNEKPNVISNYSKSVAPITPEGHVKHTNITGQSFFVPTEKSSHYATLALPRPGSMKQRGNVPPPPPPRGSKQGSAVAVEPTYVSLATIKAARAARAIAPELQPKTITTTKVLRLQAKAQENARKTAELAAALNAAQKTIQERKAAQSSTSSA